MNIKLVEIRLHVLITLILLIHTSLLGQTTKITFSHIKGLSSNSATCIVKDSYGFMWFGTTGLDRFDGYAVVNYRYNPRDKNSLNGNQIYKIFEDSKKNLWICTDAGINRYNRDLDNFSSFNSYDSQETNNPVLVHDIYQDKNGKLWIGGTGGLYSFDYRKDEFVSEKISSPGAASVGEVYSIFEDDSGNLWLGNHKRDIFLYNTINKTLRKFLIGDFKFDYKGKRNEILQIFEDSKKNVWILTSLSGVYLYSPQTSSLTNFIQDFALSGKSIMINSANSIIERENGEIWIGAGGVNIYEPGTCKWSYLQNDIDDNSTISSNISPELYIDKSGFIWVATINGGIDLFIPGKKSITHHSHVANSKNSLSHNTVLDFYEDSNGIIWIGTDGGGLDKFNPQDASFKNYPTNNENTEMLSSSSVLCLEGAENGNIWVGTYAGGLHLFNPKMNKFKKYIFDKNNPNSIGGDHIWDIRRDPVTNHIWLAILWGENGGLDEFIPNKDLFIHHSKTASVECDQKHFSVTKMICDSRGNIWIGSYEFGIDKYSKEKKCFKSYILDTEDPFSINSNHINDIFEDSKNRLWIATDNGINLFNFTDEYFMHFGNVEGMAGKEVQSIVEDNEGNLWLGTDKGISKFTLPSIVSDISKDLNYKKELPENYPLFINYDGKEDLNGNEFRPASLKSSSGLLFFGGINGFNIINPMEMELNKEKPPVVITEFMLFGQKVEISQEGKNNSPLKKNILLTDEIVLNHKQNVFSFKYVALNYSSAQKNQYAFKMEGLEENWNFVANERTATYTNLPPGSYTFRVKASNDDLIWNEEGISVRVIILPRWYQTLLFKILFALLLFLVFYSWYLYRLSTLKRQKSVLELTVKKRTESLEAANIQLKENQEKILVQKEELEYQNIEINVQRNVLEEKNKLLISQNQRITEQNDKIALYAEKIHFVDQQKINFLTNLSHEFRTPLSLIIDPTDKLLEKSSDKETEYFLDLIKKNTSRMQRLVNQMLDFVKLDSGNYKLELNVGDVIFSIKSIVDSFHYRKTQKKIDIQINSHSTSIPGLFSIDVFERIIYNLLSNSLKYTEDGGCITIDINEISENAEKSESRTELFQDRDTKTLEIIVCDTGKGIHSEHLDKIFERFYQVEGQEGQSFSGSGIGLFTVKVMVELHGGRIQVRSTKEVGTSFKIIIPIGKLKADEFKKVGEPIFVQNADIIEYTNTNFEKIAIDEFEINKLKDTNEFKKNSILIVEDDIELKAYLINILQKDFNVYSASNGIEGLKIALDDIPDLIISDIMMPELSGIELCSEVKKNQITNHIPVILLTAKSNSSDILKGYQTGADAYVTKPFDSNILVSQISNIIANREQLQKKYKGELENISHILHENKFNDPFIQKATEIVEKNLMEPYFDGEKLANELAMSLRQLYRKMEAFTSQTVNEFIRTVQLKKGAKLLAEGKLNISEVCYMIGMSNPRYFSTLFKKKFGMSPSDFLKSIEKINSE